jgi:hypothetical protein
MVAPVIAAAVPVIIDTISDLLRRWIPDPEQRAEAVQAVLSVMQQSDAAQVEIAKLEATGNWMQRSWRPALGWVFVCGAAYSVLAQPVLEWASVNFGWIAPPVLEGEAMWSMLAGMLGLGAYRTFEKVAVGRV